MNANAKKQLFIERSFHECFEKYRQNGFALSLLVVGIGRNIIGCARGKIEGTPEFTEIRKFSVSNELSTLADGISSVYNRFN